MATTVSRLTRKYQATIPEPVRTALGLQAGDAVAFEIDGERVRVRKARPLDLAFAGALEPTLQEWTTTEDDDAYRDL